MLEVDTVAHPVVACVKPARIVIVPVSLTLLKLTAARSEVALRYIRAATPVIVTPSGSIVDFRYVLVTPVVFG